MNWTNFLRARVAGNDPTLVSLNLSVYVLWPSIAEDLRRNTTITELGLADCALPDDAAQILFTKTSLTSLRLLVDQVHLKATPITWPRHLHLATTLRTLRMSTPRNPSVLREELGEALAKCTTLESISLPETKLRVEDVRNIIKNVPLRELRLTRDEMDETVSPIIRNNTSLRSLSLSKCVVGGAEGMKAIGENSNISKLNLFNVIDLDCTALHAYLKCNTTVTDLDIAMSNALCWPALDDSTASLLCSLPCLRSLELEPDATSVVKALCKRTPPQLTSLACRVGESFPAELLTNLRVPVLVIGGPNTDERLAALFKNTSITTLHPSPYYEKQPPRWQFSPRLVHLISLKMDDFPTERAEAQKERRWLYMAALISLILARANGIDRGSRLMSLPLELFTMILTPTDMYDYGLTRWAFSSIIRFLFANAAAARRRISQCESVQLSLEACTQPETDYIRVTWQQKDEDLDMERRKRASTKTK